MAIDSYLYSSPGGREYNEDCVGERVISGGKLFVAADGLGGHKYGDIASKCVVDTFKAAAEPEEDVRQWLEDTIAEAHNAVMKLQDEKAAKMRSTVAALAIKYNKAYWANVGDSRVYYIHNDTIYAITEDHSVAYKKFLLGEITRDEIATDEDQSSLLRTIGNESRNTPDIYESEEELSNGDAFLLCSDGAWEYFMDNEILFDYFKSETAEQWAQYILTRIVSRVKEGNDNLSVITVIFNQD